MKNKKYKWLILISLIIAGLAFLGLYYPDAISILLVIIMVILFPIALWGIIV